MGGMYSPFGAPHGGTPYTRRQQFQPMIGGPKQYPGGQSLDQAQPYLMPNGAMTVPDGSGGGGQDAGNRDVGMPGVGAPTSYQTGGEYPQPYGSNMGRWAGLPPELSGPML